MTHSIVWLFGRLPKRNASGACFAFGKSDAHGMTILLLSAESDVAQKCICAEVARVNFPGDLARPIPVRMCRRVLFDARDRQKNSQGNQEKANLEEHDRDFGPSAFFAKNGQFIGSFPIFRLATHLRAGYN